MEQHRIGFGKKFIHFNIIYKDRKNLRITVSPDNKVLVYSAPDKNIDDIYLKVKKRASWIIKQQNFFNQFKPLTPHKQYVSGETHRYLGRQYRLKIYQSDKKNVKLKGKYFEISLQNRKESDNIKALLYQWYREHAEIKYNQIIDRYILKLEKYGIRKPKLTIRFMKSRWGSCTKDKNKILLNLELIKAPIHCIEYVIMHELVHLKYPSHNKWFYHFMTMVMPDWKQRKERLEKFKLNL